MEHPHALIERKTEVNGLTVLTVSIGPECNLQLEKRWDGLRAVLWEYSTRGTKEDLAVLHAAVVGMLEQGKLAPGPITEFFIHRDRIDGATRDELTDLLVEFLNTGRIGPYLLAAGIQEAAAATPYSERFKVTRYEVPAPEPRGFGETGFRWKVEPI